MLVCTAQKVALCFKGKLFPAVPNGHVLSLNTTCPHKAQAAFVSCIDVRETVHPNYSAALYFTTKSAFVCV